MSSTSNIAWVHVKDLKQEPPNGVCQPLELWELISYYLKPLSFDMVCKIVIDNGNIVYFRIAFNAMA